MEQEGYSSENQCWKRVQPDPQPDPQPNLQPNPKPYPQPNPQTNPQPSPQPQIREQKLFKPLGSTKRSNLRDTIVGGKYRLISPIASGSFGELYRAIRLQCGEEVAVKLEVSAVKSPQLPREAKIYNILRGGVGFPHTRYFGTEGKYNVLVLDLLGPTLEDLLNFCARSFSLKTTLMLADQILTRVEYLHMNCLIHRDIKPENFLMGLGNQRTRLFMIDFGLAKRYYRPCTRTHINYFERKELVGTARYASIHAHYAEQGRRDDLESVGYLLIYFLRGGLPWQGICAETRQQKNEKIAESKSALPLNVLCAGLPTEFYMYIKYSRSLHFTEQPDYNYLRQLFKVLFRNQYLFFDYLYDWVDINMEVAHSKRVLALQAAENQTNEKDRKTKSNERRQQQQNRSKRHETNQITK